MIQRLPSFAVMRSFHILINASIHPRRACISIFINIITPHLKPSHPHRTRTTPPQSPQPTCTPFHSLRPTGATRNAHLAFKSPHLLPPSISSAEADRRKHEHHARRDHPCHQRWTHQHFLFIRRLGSRTSRLLRESLFTLLACLPLRCLGSGR